MNSEQEEIVIPILDLEKFVFSPPGPMGWELSEYEQQKNIVLNESSVLENLAIIKEIELEELPKIGLLDLEEQSPQKTTIIDEVKDKEVQSAIELEEQSPQKTTIIDEVKDEEIQKTRKKKTKKKKTKKKKKNTIELEEQSPQKTTIIDEVKDEEIQNAIELKEQNPEQNEVVPTQIEKPKVKVKIITPDHPLKTPWIAKLVKNAKENE
ncbi:MULTISPECIES: hypothetical protein [Bacillus cereus group]|uniref:Uncharacterized protein n=1 Tax=Bacillus cereus TaxID=1396 RepID=A0A2B1KAF7_BACCE|nr:MULTISPECIES: hypothetical protein [Bacillus cereus group]MED0943386.1 hypothetical protein [Bacillus mycoides]PFN20488.1 hypothetical protein COJ50_21750 [Bacillus cereus]HDR7624565.1 hypothetical protein [Bacillus mycoides]HDR7630450.1 hypothetical protein [Bacillus mycoides]HDR7647584.1 hypothetical protein [Bacillus mycoides]